MKPNVVLMQPPRFSGGTDLVFEQMTTVELAEKGNRNTDEPAFPITSVVCLAKREPLYSGCGFVRYDMQRSTCDPSFLTAPFVTPACRVTCLPNHNLSKGIVFRFLPVFIILRMLFQVSERWLFSGWDPPWI